MARLPQPGADDGNWGDILNEFLSVEHNGDGTLKQSGSLSSKAPTASPTFTGSVTVPVPTNATDAATKNYVDSVAMSGAPDATTSTKGLVQLAGDLGGTAASPTVPGLASKEPTLTAGTSAQYYRGDKTWQPLDKAAVGLANASNTSDANKPISTAAQTALDGKTDKSTLTTKGDLYVATAANTPARLAAGTNGQILVADSTQATGLKWDDAAAGADQQDIDIAARQLNREQAVPLSELFTDFFGLSSPPATAKTGQALGYVGSGSPAVMANGRLYAANGSGVKALYARSADLGSPVHHLGARFVFKAGSGGTSGLVCLGITTEMVTGGFTPTSIDMPLHVWSTRSTWAITIWDGSNHGGPAQVILASGSYPIALDADDVTQYEIEAWINGTTITVRLPDGTIRTASNAKVASYAGNFAFFESMRSDATDDTAGISHIWADTNEQPPAKGGVVRKSGTDIIEGYKAFMGTVNVPGNFQISTGAGVGKILVSDGFGVGTWQAPPAASPTTFKRNTLMGIGDSLTAACSAYDATNHVDSHNGGTSGGHSQSDWLFQGNLLAGSPIDILGVSATPGYSADQIIATHLPVAVAAAPTYCTVWIGGNDVLANGDTVDATLLGKIRSTCQALEAVGTIPILCSLPPANGMLPAEVDRYNAWASTEAQSKGYPFLDFFSVLVDPATGGYKSGYSDDAVHPNGAGTAAMAPLVRDLFLQISSTLGRSQLAAWNGLIGPASNPLLSLGSANTPTGWSVIGSPTLALGPSSTYPGNEWTMTRTGSDGIAFGPQISCTNGDEWDFCCRVSATPGASGTWSIGVLDNTGSAFHGYAYYQRLTISGDVILHWRGVVTNNRTSMQAIVAVGGASGSQIKVGQMTLRNLTTEGAGV
jgi:lysophospholipase L1-like esterase